MQEVQERWVLSLGQEDPLEKEMATCSSTLAWKTPWTEEPGGLQSRGSQRVAHDLAQCTRTHTHTSEMEFTLTRQSLGNFSDSDYRKVKDQI